ncbi:MAG TPA: hypothetical protein PKD70_15640, partial [Saprospiraceae bacterium]|nr:hypothetical protein [Saprospiraceae bacterium]HMP15311.1 hypothetical protein [Saprospiraceae bacterium]
VAQLAAVGDVRPTKQSYEAKEDLTKRIDVQLSEYKRVRDTELPKFNEMVRQKAVDPIMVKKQARS